ncbi:MAG: 30S ribosomal protein S15 [Candidatus Sungbacteria bacterium]|uniref:Small ribosomal subunit protein uS15 n=1 Tax=Candidatus Sungiibacteriota bacterium TaxID=2750080 RepID=A0A9D6LTK5_9BACT|nr:30S ribosomal protein S15 [Candidatus Sungbacteria bacterium]
MLKAKRKSKVIEAFRTHATDTGSSAVQVAVLTEEIEKLTGHLKKHPKDNHSRRGLLAMVSKRRRLMNYLSQSEPKRYAQVAKKLGLKVQPAVPVKTLAKK